MAPEVETKPQRLGDILVRAGAISDAQLDVALREQRRTGELLGNILIQLGFVEGGVLSSTLAAQSGVPYSDLSNFIPEHEVATLLPEQFLRERMIVPITRENGSLTLAMENVFDVVTIDEVRRRTRLSVRVVSAAANQILRALDQAYGKVTNLEELIEECLALIDRGGAGSEPSEAAPIVRLVDRLILNGLENRATDVHISPDETVVRVRYRIDGLLIQGPSLPKVIQAAIASRIKVMADLNIAESRLPQDGHIRFTIGRQDLDMRISTFPTIQGENIVIRLLHRSDLLLGLDQLGMDSDDLSRFREVIRKPTGLILVSGPTGSGKTTTLYSVLNYLNSLESHILTIEDPVEYRLPIIRQAEVKPRIGFDFAAGLRSVLRQDPDVILVSELRDTETAQIAVRAALTGHLIFSTVHTNSAVGAVTRLLDMGVPSYLIAPTLTVILAQRLLRLVCKECCVPYDPESAELETLGFSREIHAEPNFVKNVGCHHCGETGYRGRTGVFEQLIIDDELAGLISAQASQNDLEKAALRKGLRPLTHHALNKAARGLTTLAEVERVCYIVLPH